MNVFFHVRAWGSDDWHNFGREVSSLPRVGELLFTKDDDPSSQRSYRVYHVQHCLFQDTYSAEVYAVAVDHLDAMKQDAPDKLPGTAQ